MTTRLLLATRNAKKLAEVQRILDAALGGTAIELVGLADVPDFPQAPETGLTFGENALLKAREGVKYAELPTVADDSGLAVDALGGMPGVFSARWAGRHGDDRANLELVLAQLADVPDEHRGAAFVCAAALVLPGGRRTLAGSHSDKLHATEHLVDGRQTGRLLRSPRGEGGFGYDPIFVADGEARSNAELTPREKDAISHRGKAFRALAQVIARRLIS